MTPEKQVGTLWTAPVDPKCSMLGDLKPVGDPAAAAKEIARDPRWDLGEAAHAFSVPIRPETLKQMVDFKRHGTLWTTPADPEHCALAGLQNADMTAIARRVHAMPERNIRAKVAVFRIRPLSPEMLMRSTGR